MRSAFYTLLTVLLLALCCPAFADEIRYVKENFKISVRTNPSERADAIGTLNAGEQLTVLKTSGGWAQIKTPKISGWVSMALLVDTPPSVTILNDVKAEFEKLKKENDQALNELGKLRDENAGLKQILDSSNEQAQAYMTLMEKTGNDLTSLVTLKEDYDQLQKELAAKTKRLESLEKSASKAVFYNYLRWFISGAAVLVVGFLIGIITKRSNSRRYY